MTSIKTNTVSRKAREEIHAKPAKKDALFS